MISPIFTHPATTFVGGLVLALAAVFLFLGCSAAPNQSAADVRSYRSAMDKVAASGLKSGGPGEQAALTRFKTFLQSIGDKNYVRANTLNVYSADAYLDDTLAIHHGAAEIEAYFLKTSATVTSYQLSIDDTARSGEDFYVRWTMTFAAPALSGGEPVHSVGVSQVRFNRDGKVAFHRDFWDSGQNFYSHLPGVGGAISFVRKRLQSNG